MKISAIVVICAVLVATVLSDTIPEKIQRIKARFEECAKENNPPEEEIGLMKALKGVPTTKEGKCTIACILKKYKILNEDGKYDQKVTLNLAQQVSDGKREKILAAIPLCEKEVTEVSDPCENAALIAQCALKYKNQAGF